MKKFFRFSVVMLILCASLTFLIADEGEFTPDTIKYLKLEEKGLKMPAKNIFNPGGPGIQEAILLLGGGTAEFVSKDGLILTNHHVAFGSVARIATPEHNYIRDGFLATTKDKEIIAKNYQARIVRLYKEVTADILKGVKDDTPEEKRKEIIKKNTEKLKKKAEKEHPDLEISIMNVYDGAKYYLQGYFVIRDIRIVYVPPRSIGEYGGDIDNWMWPRHTGDFSFLRAYVSKDGKGAAFSKENVPYKPVTWLRSNPNGVQKGDFTMVMGFPGTTYRYRDSYYIEYQQESNLPFLVDLIQGRLDILVAEGEKNEEVKIQFAETVKGLNNALKLFAGELKAFKKINFIEIKRAYEKRLQKFIEKDPALKAQAGTALADLKSIYAERFKNDPLNYAVRSLRYSTLVSTAENLYKYVEQKDLPEKKRDEMFKDLDKARLGILGTVNRYYLPLEKNNIRKGILLAMDLPENSRIAAVDNAQGIDKDNPGSFIDEIMSSTVLKDPEQFKKLFDMSIDELKKVDDFFIQVAAEITSVDEKMTKLNDALNAKTQVIRRNLTRAMMEFKKDQGEDLYPDANRTIRFNYGYVKGYPARDAVCYEPFTTLKGVIEKNTGVAPFNVPQKLIDAFKNKNFGKWADKKLGGVPVCFLADHDITGGNSGSPVLDAEGKLVGCAFDGNYEALYSDYIFIPEMVRSITVDIRYVCYITELFGAGFILDEMEIDRN